MPEFPTAWSAAGYNYSQKSRPRNDLQHPSVAALFIRPSYALYRQDCGGGNGTQATASALAHSGPKDCLRAYRGPPDDSARRD